MTPKTLTMMKQLSATITEKDKEILKLRAHLKEVKPRLELLSSRYRQVLCCRDSVIKVSIQKRPD